MKIARGRTAVVGGHSGQTSREAGLATQTVLELLPSRTAGVTDVTCTFVLLPRGNSQTRQTLIPPKHPKMPFYSRESVLSTRLRGQRGATDEVTSRWCHTENFQRC
jgi:hypothetical protein